MQKKTLKKAKNCDRINDWFDLNFISEFIANLASEFNWTENNTDKYTL